MTKLAERRIRILKIRSIERRKAEMQLAQSETDLRHVSDLAKRIATLRHTARVEGGTHHGAELNANGEMAARLDTAQQAMVRPLALATEKCECLREKFIAARQRESGAEKLAESAAERERKESERRQNASLIFRKTNAGAGIY